VGGIIDIRLYRKIGLCVCFLVFSGRGWDGLVKMMIPWVNENRIVLDPLTRDGLMNDGLA